ncbi:hypothetical protein DAEQUDRAFT_113079 [Daedalea quercina L-15889]|uniref:PX domain-containing protein n=1 Tax=Daedalea quercina L-15889 TaxID=1314783 RepID=A0A165S637_9APHY|nr:hypothetical protein DAEQUDRAFT_113079 [Daedalea quercina L-15889]
MQRVHRSHRAHKEYLEYVESLQDSDDDDGPQDEEAWLFEDLSVLARLHSRIKDREQLIEIIFEDCNGHKSSGTVTDRNVRKATGLLKDIIPKFCAPLAQVYRAARIAALPHGLGASLSTVSTHS